MAEHGGGAEAAAASTRRIWLCADDYGLAPGINVAIRDLIGRGRLNATSVMVAAPSCSAGEIGALRALNAETTRAAIGLHLTLTAPFRPLSAGFWPTAEGAFPSLPRMVGLALLRRLEPQRLAREITAQLAAFADAFAMAPAFVDGHQHVQLLPQVREQLFSIVQSMAPQCWVRQCGSATPAWQQLSNPKGVLLNALSRGLRRAARATAIPLNPGFAGSYRFDPQANFAELFPRFLRGLPDGGVVMCHPGHVDAELRRLDPLTELRELEYRYLASEAFCDDLERHGVRLACAAAPGLAGRK